MCGFFLCDLSGLWSRPEPEPSPSQVARSTCGTPESARDIVDGRQCCAVRAPSGGGGGETSVVGAPGKKTGFGAAFSGALRVPPHKTESKLCGSNEQTPLPGLDCIRVSLYDLLLSPSRSEKTTTTPAWLVACRRLSPRVWCT